MLMPGFHKDVYGWLAHPLQEAYYKLGALPTTAIEQLINQDWRGDPIVKRDADWIDFFNQRMTHFLNKTVPISIKSVSKGQPETSGIPSVLTAIGFRAPGAAIQDPEAFENWQQAKAAREWSAKERHQRIQERKYAPRELQQP
jgi:hypothetical protein